MGRPRKFIRVVELPDHSYRRVEAGGQEIDGLSYNESNRYYYSLDETGGRVFQGRDLNEAIQRYRATVNPRPFLPISDEEALAELLSMGIPEEVVQENPDLLSRVKKRTLAPNPEFMAGHPEWPLTRANVNATRKRQGLPPLPLTDKPPAQPAAPAPPKKRLRDALNEWKKWKEAAGRSEDYITAASILFEEFIKVAGNKLIAELTADDFAQWRLWVTRHRTRENWSGKWSNSRHQCVRSVLRIARKNQRSWGWPDGIIDWAGDYETEHYQPSKANRVRLPADVFKKLLAVAEEWKKADPEAFPKTSQRGRAQRRQAIEKRREGYLWSALLKLAVNCSLDNVDCMRIEWKNIRDLDSDLPFMDFPRRKTRHRTGLVDRQTPLLPTVAATLREWRNEEFGDGQGFVFRSARGGPIANTTFTYAYRRLAKEAGVTGHTFKHIRNIGSSLGRLHKLSRDERDALLGHVVAGTSKFYEEDVDHRYLIDVVNLVGREYFDGDQILTRDVDTATA